MVGGAVALFVASVASGMGASDVVGTSTSAGVAGVVAADVSSSAGTSRPSPGAGILSSTGVLTSAGIASVAAGATVSVGAVGVGASAEVVVAGETVTLTVAGILTLTTEAS